MRRPRVAIGSLTVLVAFLLAAVVACGGDGGEGEVTATPGDGGVEGQLRQMVLQLEDLPTGVIRAEERFVTNDESAAASEDQAGRLAKLEEWGRILGYDVTYQANPEVMEQVGLMLANSTASLYDSDEGATSSFADAVETAHTTDWADLWGGAQEVESEELPSPEWVDEMLWLRITGKAELEEGEEETLANDFVLFRQGPARGTLMVAWIMGRGSGNITVQLAQAQAERLAEALP
jgi:hypothetical protein